MIERIVSRARQLEALMMSGDEEPEIDLNEKTGMVSVGKYSETLGGTVWMEDVCSAEDINLGELRTRLSYEGICYCL